MKQIKMLQIDSYQWLWFFYFNLFGIIYGKELRCPHIEYNFVAGVGGKRSISDGCADNHICKKHYTIQHINVPPYSITPILEPRLKVCCGNCINYTVSSNILPNISALTPSIMNDSDFVFPVLGSVAKNTLYGSYFIPVFSVPDYIYITPTPKPIFIRMLDECKVVIPILIIIMLMSIISGFVIWFLEASFNGEGFSLTFFRGWFEGTYWSLGTTVGFGDKTPRTNAGKLYAILWISFVLIFIGILTGLLTNGIMSANQPYKPTMKKKNIGVLSYRLADALFVAKNGAGKVNLKKSEGFDWNFWLDAIHLAGNLRDNQIDGIIMDKLTYIFVYKGVNKAWKEKGYSQLPPRYREYTKSAMEFLATKTVVTEEKHDATHFAYGILVKDKEVFEYFYDAIVDNRVIIETSITMYLSEFLKEDQLPDIFSFSNAIFKRTVTALGGAIGIIFIFGLMFCFCCQKSKMSVNSPVYL